MHLRFVEYSKPDKSSGYPFDLPLFKDFKGLKFNTPVTIFVGENRK